MRRFNLEQSQTNEITSHSGLTLIGAIIEQHTSASKTIDKKLPKRHGVPASDHVKTYFGLLAQAKNDFCAVNNVRHDRFFSQSMNIKKQVPSESSLRQRLEKDAEQLLPIINDLVVEHLIRSKATVTPLSTGHIPFDFDVTPHDNSNSKKEGVSWTYKGSDGYAPMAVYAGKEGYCLGYELRNGSHHSQNGFIETLERNYLKLRDIIGDKPVLIRLDSGHDAADNRQWIHENKEKESVDCIIKWNPRNEATDENKTKWLDYANNPKNNIIWKVPRVGKRVAVFSQEIEEFFNGKNYMTRRVMKITEQTIDKKGQGILIPNIEIEGWWTTLTIGDQDLIQLYCDHATSEQFHSEFKTDLDLERLPSGKFKTNELILAMAVLVYNILKWIGLNGLMGENSPVRHPAQRRRFRTVIQELIYLAAHVYERGRRLWMRFGKHTPAFQAYCNVYSRILC